MITVRMQKIYENIIILKGWDEQDIHTDKEKDLIGTKIRTLRNKFLVLLERKMCCNPVRFNKGGGYEVSITEAPIIQNILLGALEEHSLVDRWFKGNLNLDISENVIGLYDELQDWIFSAAGETDQVTISEWLSAIDGAIDYTNAKKTNEMKGLLEKLRATAKPINHTINYGEMIATNEDGSREYVQQPYQEQIDIGDMTINEIMKYVSKERHFFELLNILVDSFTVCAHDAAIADILYFAEAKTVMDDNGEENSARDLIQFDNMVASDYLQRFRHIYDYLKGNPEITQAIESKTGTSDLLKFFDVTGASKERKSNRKPKVKPETI